MLTYLARWGIKATRDVINVGRYRLIISAKLKKQVGHSNSQFRHMVRIAYSSALLHIAGLVNGKFSKCLVLTQHISGRDARVF